MQKRETGNKEL